MRLEAKQVEGETITESITSNMNRFHPHIVPFEDEDIASMEVCSDCDSEEVGCRIASHHDSYKKLTPHPQTGGSKSLRATNDQSSAIQQEGSL